MERGAKVCWYLEDTRLFARNLEDTRLKGIDPFLNEGGRSGRFRPGSSTIWWNSVTTLLSSIINSLCKLLRSSLGRIPTSSRHCNRSVTKCHRRKNCVISSLNMDVSDIKHVGSSVLTRQVDEIVHRQHDTHTKSHKLICPVTMPLSLWHTHLHLWVNCLYTSGEGSLIIWKI